MKIFLSLILIVIAILSLAQSPNTFSYQGIVRDTDNRLVRNSNVGMQISILRDSMNAKTEYVERHFPQTNENGLVSIEIGAGITISGNFRIINWGDGPYFLKVETDLNGGASYTISGTSQLLSVPFSMYSEVAGRLADSSTYIEKSGLDFVEKNAVVRLSTDRNSSNMNSISLTVPCAGYIVVTANGNIFNNPEGIHNSLMVRIIVSTSIHDIREGPGGAIIRRNGSILGRGAFPFSVSKVYKVNPGTHTYYLNIWVQQQNGDTYVYPYTLFGTFYPNRY